MSAAPQLDYDGTRERIQQHPAVRALWVRESWRRGALGWKLRLYQLPAYFAVWAAINNPLVLKFCLNINRRWGKTFLLSLIAIELCMRKTSCRVRFAAPTLDELRERILPIFEEILQDCPAEMRPVWRAQRKAWIFPNGARIYLAGVNNQGARKLRGSGADLCIVDEGGFIDEVEKLIDDVMIPQLLDTHGTLIGGSTPPDSAAHEFVSFHDDCYASGNLFHADIYSMGLEQWEVDTFATAAGGYDSIRFRREWLAEYVTDVELQIIPDFDKTKHVGPPRASKLSKFWQGYTAMDIGATRRDFTAVLFAHYDFEEARLYVRRELIDKKLPRLKTPELAKKITAQERALWGKHAAPHRWADNNNVELLMDLATDDVFPVRFDPTSKDELPSMVNKLRVWVKTGRVVVDPACTNLIDCLAKGTWRAHDDGRYIGVEFARSTSLGHLDALAALIYMVRNIDEMTNPVPADHAYDPTRQMWRDRDQLQSHELELAEYFEPVMDS